MSEIINVTGQVKLAYEFYRNKDYVNSLNAFTDLSIRLGFENFSYNLKKIHQSSNFENSAGLKSFRPLEMFWQEMHEATTVTVTNTGVLLRSVWRDHAIGATISLKPQHLTVDYNRKLLVTPRFYSRGILIEGEYENFSHSKSFLNYKYLEKAEDGYKAEIIYPAGVDNAELTLYSFNITGEHEFDTSVNVCKQPRGESSLSKFAYENILELAAALPDSNGSRHHQKINATVGIIADIYMYNFYKDVFSEVVYLAPDNIKEVLRRYDFDLIIYSTCWKGINNEEWRGLKFREKPINALEEILKYCKERKVTTIFQSIEDPSNYDYFLPIAIKFDYIFTSDTDCIDKYIADCSHDRVYYGEYGANPQLNNPIGSRRFIENAVFFAGSYPARYQERCQDMNIVMDSVVATKGSLVIADRNYTSTDNSVAFPVKFSGNIFPPIDHSLLQKVHKLFRHNLNFNSIKNSPTMCAMRVYELQAQGCNLISNYADSVFNKFPNVRTLPKEADLSFDLAANETWYEYYMRIYALRNVMTDKTSFDVVRTMMECIGYTKLEDCPPAKIALICQPEITDEQVRLFIQQQSYQAVTPVVLQSVDSWNEFCLKNDISYFIWFNSSFQYGRYFLQDLLNGFKYTDQDYITKGSYFYDNVLHKGIEHEYTSICRGGALTLFSAKNISPDMLKGISLVGDIPIANGYAIDPFELNFANFAAPSIETSAGSSDYILSVIVPVYNNGRFLMTKCFPSLLRNKLFSKFEIILVDDGSNEAETFLVMDNLRKSFPNVIVFLSNDGGSGSASRPRNIGIDNANAPLVTFLDPDNEISPGGYDNLVRLYQAYKDRNDVELDFISGYHLKVSETVSIIGRHSNEKLKVLKDFKNIFFKHGKFPVIPTQPAVLSRKMLVERALRFVEGSAGQDTLFGWELIARSKVGAFTNDAFLIYYANRTDSITNVIDLSYFSKKLRLEAAQSRFLKEMDIMTEYIDSHFDSFMKSWYLPKFKCISPTDQVAAYMHMSDICKLYNKDIKDYSEFKIS